MRALCTVNSVHCTLYTYAGAKCAMCSANILNAEKLIIICYYELRDAEYRMQYVLTTTQL